MYPTAKELCAILGPRWAICKNTERNRGRYGRCISRKAYQRAQIEALRQRGRP